MKFGWLKIGKEKIVSRVARENWLWVNSGREIFKRSYNANISRACCEFVFAWVRLLRERIQSTPANLLHLL